MNTQTEQLGKVCFTVDKNYHNINRDYDKLVIVESYEDRATYASRKPVPAGTPLTDREYWIKFSSLAEHIQQNYNVIQQELNALYDKVGVGITFSGDYSTFDVGKSKTITLNFATVNAAEKASVVKLYQSDTLMDTYNNISEFTKEVTVSDEVTFRVVATIGEYTYSATWEVTRAYDWYIGGGTTHEDAMIEENKHSGTDESIASIQSVNINNSGDHIFICVQKDIFLPEVTMNGFTVPFDAPYTEIVDGVEYNIYKSSNAYTINTYVLKLDAANWNEDEIFRNLISIVTGFDSETEDLQNRMETAEAVYERHDRQISNIIDRIDPLIERTGGSGEDAQPIRRAPAPWDEYRGIKHIQLLPKEEEAILTQEDFTEENAIYVIQYNFELAEDITIPENCVLQFEGGSLNNNKLTFTNTTLCGNVRLNTNFAGTLLNKTFYISWLFNKSLLDGDYYSLNEDVLSLLSDGIYIFDRLKYIIPPISVKSNVIIDLNGSEIKCKNDVDNTPILDVINKENIVIKNGIIDGNKVNVSGNNAHGIRIVTSNKITISNIYFKNINRACIVSTDSNYITLNKIIAENCGGQNDSIGCLFNTYDCTNVIALDCVFKNSNGVGAYIVGGSNFDIRNIDIYNVSTDNGLTLEDASNVNLENIKIDTVDNAGLEINASENINVKNINIDNCSHHGLMISVYRPSTYKACKNILLQNLKISNSGEGYYDVDVISAIDCSIINLQCEKIFITKNSDTGDNKNITISNTEASSLQISNSDLSIINCSFTAISGNNYTINKFPVGENTIDIYYNKLIPANETDTIELPNNGGQIYAMSGIIDVISYFTQSFNQNNKKLISFKIIESTYYSDEISSIDGTVARPVSFSLTTPNLIINNNNSIEIRCILRIVGEYNNQ